MHWIINLSETACLQNQSQISQGSNCGFWIFRWRILGEATVWNKKWPFWYVNLFQIEDIRKLVYLVDFSANFTRDTTFVLDSFPVLKIPSDKRSTRKWKNLLLLEQTQTHTGRSYISSCLHCKRINSLKWKDLFSYYVRWHEDTHKNQPGYQRPSLYWQHLSPKILPLKPIIYFKKHMLWIFVRGDSNKYPQPIFLGVLYTVFLNISNYLPHLEQRIPSIQTVIITNFVVISNVGIKRFDCICSLIMNICWLY